MALKQLGQNTTEEFFETLIYSFNTSNVSVE